MDLKCPYDGGAIEIEEYGYPYDETTYYRMVCENTLSCGARFSRYGGYADQEGKNQHPRLIDSDGDVWVWRTLTTGTTGYVCEDTYGDVEEHLISPYPREQVERMHGPVRVDTD